MDAATAKEFLISKVVEQAGAEGVPLTEIERKMLYFTEQGGSSPGLYEVNAEFERNYDPYKYEAKIMQLLKAARSRDGQGSPDQEQKWKEALDALKDQDHYILVMSGEAFGFPENPKRKLLIYLAIGVTIFLLVFLGILLRAAS
jgi:hypothetical protein